MSTKTRKERALQKNLALTPLQQGVLRQEEALNVQVHGTCYEGYKQDIRQHLEGLWGI